MRQERSGLALAVGIEMISTKRVRPQEMTLGEPAAQPVALPHHGLPRLNSARDPTK
jgi:hypothetical protein